MVDIEVPAAAATVATESPGSLAARRYGTVALVGLLATVLLLAALPLLPGPRLDPLATPVSDYAALPFGELLFAAAACCLILGSLALAGGLRAIGAHRGRGVAALWCLWCG